MASLLLACGTAEEDDEAEAPAANSQVVAFGGQSGIEFRECGDVEAHGCWDGSCDGDTACSTERSEAQDCMAAAFESCTPAHLREWTEHGSGWGTKDFFVVPEGDACLVVYFETEQVPELECDYVVRWDCEELIRDPDSGGCGLYGVGCGDPMQLEGDRRACRL